jgi:hypothetical protein
MTAVLSRKKCERPTSVHRGCCRGGALEAEIMLLPRRSAAFPIILSLRHFLFLLSILHTPSHIRVEHDNIYITVMPICIVYWHAVFACELRFT